MSDPHSTPIVAVIGRPNVGKSTLFNRFAGHRRALVANQPGMTRDRIAEEIEVLGRRILLVDTAGLDPDAERGLPAAIQAQAESAVADADAILFVVDGKAGLLPQDESIARTLRKTRKPLVLAVNKIDQPTHHADRVAEFHRLGLEHVHGVSGEHGGGAFDALEALIGLLPPADPDAVETDEARTRVTLVGRPNVGKSSLTNRLLGQERVVVSEEAGTTRDAIDTHLDFESDRFTLIDTAGLRRPGRREGTGEKIGALMTVRSVERAQVALLVIDCGEGFTDQDAHIARLVRDMGSSAVVVANKWDLVAKEKRRDMLDAIGHGLRFMADAPIVPVSAKTGSGVGKLLPLVGSVAEAGGRRITTSQLNRWLADATARHDPGMAKRGASRHVMKFHYATQVGVHPPRFVVFCSDPDAVTAGYRRYLENRLREAFPFEGTPIRLGLRGRRDDAGRD